MVLTIAWISGIKASEEAVSYSLVNEKSQRAINGEINDTMSRIRVPQGSYNLQLFQNNYSYFAAVKASGFFRTLRVSTALMPESQRRFVGDNPGYCMDYVGGKLVSYACGDLFSNLKIHEPAAADTPSYTLTNSSASIDGSVLGLAETDMGPVALLKTVGPANGYVLAEVSDDLKLLNTINLAGLDSSRQYTIRSAGSGFLLYDLSFDKVLYYSSIKAAPTAVSVPKPDDPKLSPVYLDFDGSHYVSLYGQSEQAESKGSENSVAITDIGGTTRTYRFNQGYTQGRICGETEICLISDSGSDVYDVAGKNVKLEFTIDGAKDILFAGASPIFINKTGLLNLDIAKRTGYYAYTFGDYKYNSSHSTNNGIVLNLTNSLGKSSALLVNPAYQGTDGIDKKIEQLEKLPQISLVSIYGNDIYISANLGPLVYDPKIQGYNYNQQVKTATAAKINSEVDKLGISRSAYTISSNAF